MAVVIGCLSLEIFLPYSHSLKEKRQVLNAFKDRIRRKFNIACAELEFQEKWQRAKIGVVTVNSQQSLVQQILQKILEEAESTLGGEVLKSEIQYF